LVLPPEPRQQGVQAADLLPRASAAHRLDARQAGDMPHTDRPRSGEADLSTDNVSYFFQVLKQEANLLIIIAGGKGSVK
jgi:hypothetical protein